MLLGVYVISLFHSKLHNLPTVIDLTRYCQSVCSQCSSDGILVEGPSAKVAARTTFHSSNGQKRVQWLRRSLLLQKRRRPGSHLQQAAWWGPCHQVVHLHPLHGLDNALLLLEALRLGVVITLWGQQRPKLIIGLSGRRQILPKRKPLGCCASTTGTIIWTARRRRRLRAFAWLESWHNRSVVEEAGGKDRWTRDSPACVQTKLSQPDLQDVSPSIGQRGRCNEQLHRRYVYASEGCHGSDSSISRQSCKVAGCRLVVIEIQSSESGSLLTSTRTFLWAGRASLWVVGTVPIGRLNFE